MEFLKVSENNDLNKNETEYIQRYYEYSWPYKTYS